MSVLSIAETWSFWDGDPPDSIPRAVELPRKLDPRLALFVLGVRRAGKSTLLQQCLERYGLNPKNCLFLNFEDPRFSSGANHETLDQVVEAFRSARKRVKNLYFFFDEIQWVEGWQRWLRTQLERPSGAHFIVTGSNARLLSGELGTSLTGRHLSVTLTPFSYSEARQMQPRLKVGEYLQGGGFPAVQGEADGDMLLRQYFSDIVERDIRERLRARSSRPIRQLAQMVFESAGSELSLRRASAATGVAVDTARDYVDACEAAHLFFGCSFFAFSERKRATMNRKFYPVDSALRRVVVTQTGKDLGKALECATFSALSRRYPDVFYWRGKGEVDFVATDGARIVPHQVTWQEPTERHYQALDEFYANFPQAEEAVFVTKDSFVDLEL